MGYESKLFIVNESNFGKRVWAEEIAMIDVCKCPGLRNVFREEAEGFVLGYDGNSEITHDRYDEPMMVAPLEDVYDFLMEVWKNEKYWRAKIRGRPDKEHYGNGLQDER